jgi:hypothetical protein
LAVFLVLLCSISLPTVVLAGGKHYPIEGTVTALGTSREATDGGGNTPVFTHVHRTYTVKTPTRVFVLECPYMMDGLHIHSASECGGKKKIEIGDAIRFRVEKDHAYVLTAQGKDQKLRVVSEGVNEAGNPVPATSQQP